ncbi:MAG: 3-oxo-5a-steroid 4- dehydrogenase [Geoglossum umbratile]|nr:MAG: 3-oxo-5a-steroid 4- dehydrogenase [Geoglossum umbratile]
MESKIITLAVKPRGKPIDSLPEELEAPKSGSAAQLYQSLASKSRISVHRLRITKGIDGSYIPNSKDVTLGRTGLRDQSVIFVKDLGPQIAWRTVFVVEYLGPLLIHPLVYFLRPYIYKTNEPPSELQTLSLILITAHFLKREFETLFVHRFSLATMPVFNIFKNSIHYWALAGANLAYWVYAPGSPTTRPLNPAIIYPALVLYAVSQVCNLSTHITLRNLRSPGSTERGIPTGLGFGIVTCPNYLYEILAWVAIWLVTWSLSTGVFILPAVVQMQLWAKKKELRYRKDFPGKYQRKRYAIVPGLF